VTVTVTATATATATVPIVYHVSIAIRAVWRESFC
jgi:hypothetical protein